ncbi:putative ribonuclease H-like domain-containing protein [Tanacetum coccineum]
MRMEQYLTNTDYSLWQVIMNGDGPIQVTTDEKGVETEVPPKTAQALLQRQRERKAKSILLLAIPDEYQLRFHGIKDAKSLWAAIKSRFGGNVETKKIQKTVLKQQFENFSVYNTEGLDKAYDRNKDGINDLDIDDLYNNLKVFEADIKGSSGSSSNSQNVAFFSAKDTSSSNEVNTANGVSTALGHNSQGQASSSSYTDDLMFSFFANQSNSPQLDDEDLEQIDHDDLEEMDLKWQVFIKLRLNALTVIEGAILQGNVEHQEIKGTRMEMQDGLGYDWSYIAQDKPTKFALIAYTSNSSGSDTEKNKAFYEEKIDVLEFEVKDKSNVVTRLKNQLDETLREKDNLKAKLEQFETSSKNLSKLINSQLSSKDKTCLGYGDQLNENDSSGSELFNSVFDSRSSDGDDNQKNDRFKKDNGYHVVPPPLTGNYIPPLADLSFAGLDDSVYRPTTNKTSASVSQVETISDDEDIFQSNDLQAIDKPSLKRIKFTNARNESVKPKQAEKPRMVTQSPKVDRKDWNGKMTQKLGLGFGFTKKACFVCGSHNHLIKDCDFHEKRMSKKSVLNDKGKGTGHREVRPIWNNTQRINHQNKFVPTAVLTRSGRIPVSTAKQVSKVKVNTVKVNGVNTAGQTVVSTVKGNGVTAVKASAGGRSRYRQGTKPYLRLSMNIDGGLVAFGGSTRGGNSVLFTETECLVLSPDFKLIDESQVLLRVPRQNNMYSFDLKNVVPSGDLTCLFAKATIDESKLWHRRLGHVNFKTMNKLVKGNLVRGLPSKTFENDHTCVACQKGKQHKASCKTKHVSSISQPLQMLHMDLFGPTSVRSINHKTYCLVVTDDFSRFSWVFFLATKSETSGILKKFITEVENQLNHKVKVTRVLVTKPHNKTPYELIIGIAPSISFMRPFGCHVTILNTLYSLGKFDGKAKEGFLVGYSVNSKAFRGKENNWFFDIDSLTNSMNYQPVTAGNQTNKNAGLQETNSNIGLKKNVDVGQTKEENVSTQQYIILSQFPLWSSISSSNKSSDETDGDDTANDAAGEKPAQKPTSGNEQALKNILDKMMDQEKEATEQSDAVRKEFEAQCNMELRQGKATRASSSNNFNTVSTPVNTAGGSRIFGDAGSSFVPLSKFTNLLDYPLMLDLEDTTEVPNTGIFGSTYDDDDLDTCNSPYADQVVGAKADFNNMEPYTVVIPIPTTRLHSIHPKDQIIRDPRLVVQTRGMAKKSSGEHAMISYIPNHRIPNRQRFLKQLICLFPFSAGTNKDSLIP